MSGTITYSVDKIKKNLRYYLVNFGAFFCMIPFVAPIPIKADVQYPIFLLCCAVIFLDIIEHKFALRKIEVGFLIVGFVSLIYINPYVEYYYDFFKRVGLLFGFFIFYVYSRNWHQVKPSYIMAGFYLTYAGAVIQYFFPAKFISIAKIVTRDIKKVGESKGVSSLAAEPGFLGGMCLFYILIALILMNQRKISKNKFIFIFVLSVILMFFTKSGTAMLSLFVMCGVSFLYSSIDLWKKILSGFFAVIIMYGLIYHSGLQGRGIYLAKNMIENPEWVFTKDGSVAERGISVAVGVSSMAQGYIFGHGVGTFETVGDEIIAESSFGEVYEAVIHGATGILSALGQYLVEMGIIFIFLLAWLYFNTRSLGYVKIVRITSLLYIVASFSILFPPLWMLLASTDLRNLRNRRFGKLYIGSKKSIN